MPCLTTPVSEVEIRKEKTPERLVTSVASGGT